MFIHLYRLTMKSYLNETVSVLCSNKSIVVTADNSVVSWGSSPTYGELVSFKLPLHHS